MKPKNKIPKWELCKLNNYHSWSGKHGANVDSCGESYDSMEVTFQCNHCGAEATGSVDWDNQEEDDD